ncbi:MAG: AAA family ATPase [Egibacteraceae bacterium]
MSAAPGHEPLLAAFGRAGVLADGDLAVAGTLSRLTGERTPEVVLAAALAVRAPRLGHVCVDLDAVAGHTVAEPAAAGAPAPTALPWPAPAAWRDMLAASPAVAVEPAGGRPGSPGQGGAADAGAARPLVLAGSRLYLDRYWRYERRLAAALVARVAGPRADVDPAAVRAAIERLLPPAEPDGDGPDRQRLAVAAGATGALTVVTGGPGTGKTTVVARLLAVLLALAEDPARPPRLALAAPTGKAAARLDESLRDAVAGLGLDAGLGAALAGVRARTLHRLLGSRGPGRTRFRHDAANPLDVDAVVVDEASMVPLALMAKLVDAVPASARLVLLGDRDQLASVEAGAVLGDVCGPEEAAEAPRSPAARQRLAVASGRPVPGGEADAPGVGDAIVRLTRFHRFGADSAIGRLAAAIRGLDEDPAPALAVLADDADEGAVRWRGDEAGVRAALAEAAEVYAEVAAHAAAGRATEALAGLDRCRVLCAPPIWIASLRSQRRHFLMCS